MVRWAWLVLALVGCGKKPTEAVPATDTEAVPGGFVQIDMTDEESEDMFPELLKATAPCGDLVALEPSAMMGKLTDAEIRCLDQALRDSDRLTVKDKISRVLMKDAYNKGNEDRWEAIALRHLQEIDQSDPDICFSYARQLSKKGAETADETLRWADVALENRARWTGDTYVSRVYGLYRVKAIAAQAKWAALEEEYVATPSEALSTSKDEARNLTKTLAREWLEYARQSGKDPTMPLQVCISAAGTDGYCDEN